MNTKRYLILIGCLAALSLSGCKWDDVSYNSYVDANDGVISCPPLMDLDENAEFYIPMHYIRCYRNRTVPENAQYSYLMEYKKCLNYQRNWDKLNGLLGFIGYMEGRPFSDGFKNDICPADYPTCIYDEEKSLWGCIDCLPGYVKCGGTCIDPLTDSNYCGANKTCQGAHHCTDSQVCMNGTCQVNTCASNRKFCGINDCRLVTSNDPDNCGDCDYKCSEHPTTSAESNFCKSGECQYECKMGYTDCGVKKTADEIICIENSSFSYNAEHCGRCNVKCGPNEVCISGVCQMNTCTDGLTLCGLNDCRKVNGNDADNCGLCNYKCSEHPMASATSNTCVSGKCQYICNEGLFNIGSDENPICIDPLSEQHHCGKIDNVLFPEETLNDCKKNACVNGECVTTSCTDTNETICPPLSADSSLYCADLKNDVNNCGFCGYACAQSNGPNTVLMGCVDSKCVYDCKKDPNIIKCSSEDSETLKCVNIMADSANCGRCGNVCNPDAFCFGGICSGPACSESCTDSSGDNCSELGCPSNDCKNDVNSCGPSCINCIDSEHGEPGYTECNWNSGECVISKCQYGYHMVGESLFGDYKCVKNSDNACGSRSIDDVRTCQAPSKCSDDEEKCVLECSPGTHPNESNTECIQNPPTDCGDAHINCLSEEYHAASANCNHGKCSISTCEPGYHYVRKTGSQEICETFECLINLKYAACEENKRSACGPADEEKFLNCGNYDNNHEHVSSDCDKISGQCICSDFNFEICRTSRNTTFSCRNSCSQNYLLYK